MNFDRLLVAGSVVTLLAVGVSMYTGPADPAPPSPPVAKERKFPSRVLVFRREGGPDIWQKLGENFDLDIDSFKHFKDGWRGAVRVTSMSIGSHNLRCDYMESLIPVRQGQYEGARVACANDDGHYRVYFVSRHIDRPDDRYRAAYWRKDQ